MASLGFRPPQFSEDSAWLPPWLHNHHHHRQVEASADRVSDPLSASNQALKDLIFLQGNSSDNGKDAEFLSSEEGRYNSCHLYLSSGQDDSQHSVADPPPSQRHVPRLSLHLSSGDTSQYSQSQLLYASQTLHGSEKFLSLQQVKKTTAHGKESYQLKIDHNSDGAEFSPPISVPVALEDVIPHSPTNKKDGESQLEEKIDYNRGVHMLPLSSVQKAVENIGPLSPINYKGSEQNKEKCNSLHIKDADINDAVELSIAASEALVIHELMKTGLASEGPPTQAILEAALQVKHARMETLKYDYNCSSDEIDEIDFLSDLDNSIMMDAFLDVGLSFNGSDYRHVCGSDVSQVEETPALENDYGDNESKHVQHSAQQDKNFYDFALGLTSSNVPYPVDPMLHPSAEKVLNVSAVSQPQVNVDFSAACISDNAGEEKVHFSVEGRFRSRWLGGWTVKEADVSTKLQNNTKSIPKCFVGETSFLSESADIASDENSFVKGHAMSSKIVSQSSIPFECLCDEGDRGILASREARSSNLSLVDPLCSVVPCSISSENAGSPLVHNQSNREADNENCFSPKSEHGMDNFQRSLNLNVESVYSDDKTLPTTAESSGASVRRQLTSLKAYSTLLPKGDAILEGRRHYHNQQFSSGCVDLGLGCTRLSDKGNCKVSLPLGAVFESTVGRANEAILDVPVIRNLVAETSNQKKSHDQPAKEGAGIQIQPSIQRGSPLILNRRTRCRLQASEIYFNNLTGERNPKKIMAQETKVKLHHSKNLQKIESKSKNLHGTQNRVCFSEVEVELQQNKDLQKLKTSCPTSHRKSSTARANKRSKYYNPSSDSHNQDGENYFTCHRKDVKRLIFYGVEFLLTGLSRKKEKVIVGLIQNYGGIILLDIPSPPSSSRAKRISRSSFQKLPIVICSKKLQTVKFLYGCAVNALILKVNWLTDSVAAGFLVPPEKYVILSNQIDSMCTRIGKSVFHGDCKCIFDRVGIVLHGKRSFCTKLAAIIKHGGGQVFKALQRLFQSLEAAKVSVGVIVAEDQSRALRHLKLCASEMKIPMMSASWITKSLHLGKLLPFKKKEDIPLTVKVTEFTPSVDWSQEI